VTPEQAAAAGKRAILKVGGAFAHDPRTMRKARQLGLEKTLAPRGRPRREIVTAK